jgi:hypothetical protein
MELSREEVLKATARLWRVCHDHGLTGPALAAE